VQSDGFTSPSEQRGQELEPAEVIVDTASHLACSSVDLDVPGESVSYVVGWREDGAPDAATEFAKTIDELARCIETVLATPRTAGI
jgi:hypothetical protein